MGGDYPSSDFQIMEDGGLRRVVHIPTGMTIESSRLPADPILVSSTYTVEFAGGVDRPGEVTQAALRHLRVWLLRRYGKGASLRGGRSRLATGFLLRGRADVLCAYRASSQTLSSKGNLR
jgi:hypothetical protein